MANYIKDVVYVIEKSSINLKQTHLFASPDESFLSVLPKQHTYCVRPNLERATHSKLMLLLSFAFTGC